MLLLFVPFRDEGSLLVQGESTEAAFIQLMESNSGMYTYHDRLQQMLKANAKMKSMKQDRRRQSKLMTKRRKAMDSKLLEKKQQQRMMCKTCKPIALTK